LEGTAIKQYYSMEDRVENFKLYYKRLNKRPLIGFFVGSEYPLFRYESSRSLPVDRPLLPEDFNVDGYIEDSNRLFDINEECGGDFIWSASAFWGIPWLEAAIGCPIYANHSTGSIHSELKDNFTDADSIPDFDENSPWIVKLEEFLNKLSLSSRGKWPISVTRMRGISDLLSTLYGGENFIFAMMEKPDEVKEVCQKLTEYWIDFGKFQLERIPLFHGGIGSFYYNMWAPEGTIWHQEDAAALLSPKLYNEFIRPCDERIVKSFPGCIIHQHSKGYVPTEAYINMGMTALEMHIDEGGPSAEELYETHMKILKKKPLLIWGKMTNKDIEWIFKKLPYSGLAVQIVVSGREEAAEYLERIRYLIANR